LVFLSRRFGLEQSEEEGLRGWKVLLATVSNWKDPAQLLIIPLTIYSGLEQGFFGADFTAVRRNGPKVSPPTTASSP